MKAKPTLIQSYYPVSSSQKLNCWVQFSIVRLIKSLYLLNTNANSIYAIDWLIDIINDKLT